MKHKDKITVTRFCSRAELDAFKQGEVLKNDADHFKGGFGGSISKGFCFTADKPKDAWRYLKGIVDEGCCAVFEFNKGDLMQSMGVYCGDDNHRCFKKEYCCRMYSQANARLVKEIPMTEFESEETLKMMRELRLNVLAKL